MDDADAIYLDLHVITHLYASSEQDAARGCGNPERRVGAQGRQQRERQAFLIATPPKAFSGGPSLPPAYVHAPLFSGQGSINRPVLPLNS